MPRLVINNLTELKAFQQKIKTLSAAIPFIQKKALINFSNDIVLEQIKDKMKANDFSQKIIDATFVGPIVLSPKKAQIHYISNYESDTGFDVSVAREEGTDDHIIRPKKKGGVLRWEAPNGEIAYSKGHEVSGMERLLIIERTIKENEVQASDLFGEQLADESSKILGV